MASRSVRKRRHMKPYKEWKRPSATAQIIKLLKELDGRYPESCYDPTLGLASPQRGDGRR